MDHDLTPRGGKTERPQHRPPPARGGRRGRGTRRLDPSSPCLNCGDRTRGEYCPSCGQRKTAVQVSVRAMIAEALEDELAVDRRLPRTLRALFLEPGRLTVEYVNGRIVRYVRPFRLYLISSVIFFLLLSFTSLRLVRGTDVDPGARAPSPVADTIDLATVDSVLADVQTALQEEGVPGPARDALRATRNELIRQRAALQARDRAITGPEAEDTAGVDAPATSREQEDPMAFLDDVNLRLGHPALDSAAAAKIRQLRRMEPRQAVERLVRDFIGYVPTIMFLLLPLFAGLLKLLYIRRRRFYAEHFIFLLHTHAFLYLLFTVLLVAVAIGWVRGWAFTLMLGWMLVYAYLGMRRVYGQGRVKTFAKLWVLGWMYFWILAFTVPLAFIATALLV